MAGAVALSAKPGKRYNARVTGYVWFLCLIGGSGGLLLGYDNGIIGQSFIPHANLGRQRSSLRLTSVALWCSRKRRW